MERTIKVTGTGRVSIKPDKTIVGLRFTNVLPTYEDALKASAEEVNIVKDALERVGIDRKSLKTTHFDIDTHYESYRDEHNNYKSKFDGYEYNQSLTFDFDVDNKLLGKVLFILSKLPVHPEFRINYGVKDYEKAKNELLESAIKDSLKKVDIISKAAGVELDGIQSINYSWIDVEFSSRSYDINECCCTKGAPEVNGCLDIDIEPDDIDRSDNITVIFNIK